MRALNMVLTAGAAALIGLSASQASATTQIVNVSSAGNTGTTISLGAGDYALSFIDNSVDSAAIYDAWSAWSSVQGCDVNGMNCTRGYRLSLAIDFGHGTGTFDRQDGLAFAAFAIQGNNHVYATPGQALSNIADDNLHVAPLDQLNNAVPSPYPILFSIGTGQNVNFFIRDTYYADNRGGVSLLIASVPEPATWAMMLIGFGMVGATLRRRRSAGTNLAVA